MKGGCLIYGSNPNIHVYIYIYIYIYIYTLFKDVDPSQIFAFLKEIGLFKKF